MWIGFDRSQPYGNRFQRARMFWKGETFIFKYIVEKKYTNPIAKLNKFSIQFKDYYGNLYDFSNIEHSLYFKITTLYTVLYIYILLNNVKLSKLTLVIITELSNNSIHESLTKSK